MSQLVAPTLLRQQIHSAFEVADQSIAHFSDLPRHKIAPFIVEVKRNQGLPVHGPKAVEALVKKITSMVTEENHLMVLGGLIAEAGEAEHKQGLLAPCLFVVFQRNFQIHLDKRIELCSHAISSTTLYDRMKTIVTFLRGGGEMRVTSQDIEAYKRAKERHPRLPDFVTDGVVKSEAQPSFLSKKLQFYAESTFPSSFPLVEDLERHRLLVRLDLYFRGIRFQRSRNEVEEGLKGTNLKSQSTPLSIITDYHRTTDQFITDKELQLFKITPEYLENRASFNIMENSTW